MPNLEGKTPSSSGFVDVLSYAIKSDNFSFDIEISDFKKFLKCRSVVDSPMYPTSSDCGCRWVFSVASPQNGNDLLRCYLRFANSRTTGTKHVKCTIMVSSDSGQPISFGYIDEKIGGETSVPCTWECTNWSTETNVKNEQFAGLQIHVTVEVFVDGLKRSTPFPTRVSWLIRDLLSSLETGTWSDATILAAGRIVPVHRAMLSVRSKVMAEILDNDSSDRTANVVHATHDFDAETVMAILKYIYGTETPRFDFGLATNILKMSERFQVPAMKARNFYPSH